MTRRTALAALTLPLLAWHPAAPAQAAPSGSCAAPTIVGTERGDRLRGTDGPDVIAGLGGNDVIRGFGGDDVLCGGEGADDLHGGPGDDRLLGGRDHREKTFGGVHWYGDQLDGGPGDDRMVPGRDPRSPRLNDVVSYKSSDAAVVVDLGAGTATGDGNDRIVGAVAMLWGSHFDDDLRGSAGPDTIWAMRGHDRVVVGRGNDALFGEALDDDDEVSDEAGNELSGGPGRDVVVAFHGDDVLSGGPGADRLAAYTGTDRLDGGRGDDVLQDTFTTEPDQVLEGGPGRDRIEAELTPPVDDVYQDEGTAELDLGAGTLRFLVGGIAGAAAVLDLEDATVEQAQHWTVRGTERRNVLDGRYAGSVRFEALGGRDVLVGSRRADVLDGGAGLDRAAGRGGRDQYVGVERVEEQAGPS